MPANKVETLDQLNQRLTNEIFGNTESVPVFAPVPDFIIGTPNWLFGTGPVVEKPTEPEPKNEKEGPDDLDPDEE